MYHDQALIPIKTLGFDGGVNVTLGLPFVRTSPDHGTALDDRRHRRAPIRSSLIAALRLARVEMAPPAHAMSRAEARADALPPLREVIAAPRPDGAQEPRPEFLLDLNLTRRIARAAAPLEGVTVIEVGPGPGGLTRALLLEGASRVVAVERDAGCCRRLRPSPRRYPGRLTVIEADALALDWADVAGGARQGSSPTCPTTSRRRCWSRWLTAADWPPWWLSLTLMFQKEVAERIVAAPGSKA